MTRCVGARVRCADGHARQTLTKGKEDLENGVLRLDDASPDKLPLVVGLLLLHLKFQTDSLISCDVYEACCTAVSHTKGSSALCAALNTIIDANLKPPRRRALREFLRYLWLLQSHRQANGLDSIGECTRVWLVCCVAVLTRAALATRFGNYLIRPPSGTEPVLSRVKLMGALAILIEAGPAKSGAGAPPVSAVPSSVTALASPPQPALTKQGSHSELATSVHAKGRALSASADNAPFVRNPTRTAPSMSVSAHTGPQASGLAGSQSGMQTVDIARSAVIVIDRCVRECVFVSVRDCTNVANGLQCAEVADETAIGMCVCVCVCACGCGSVADGLAIGRGWPRLRTASSWWTC